MNRVIHFEIHAEDPERAQRFYKDMFAWRFKPWEGVPYWIIETGDGSGGQGIDGGLVLRRGEAPKEGQPVNAFPCTVEVADLDAMLQRVDTAGGSVALPRMPIPGVGWLAYCKDTEGNLFGMMQPDPTAKA